MSDEQKSAFAKMCALALWPRRLYWPSHPDDGPGISEVSARSGVIYPFSIERFENEKIVERANRAKEERRAQWIRENVATISAWRPDAAFDAAEQMADELERRGYL